MNIILALFAVGGAIVLFLFIHSMLDAIVFKLPKMLRIDSIESPENAAQRENEANEEFKNIFGFMPQEASPSLVNAILMRLAHDVRIMRTQNNSLRRLRINDARKVRGGAKFKVRQATARLRRAQVLAQKFGFSEVTLSKPIVR